MRFFQFLSTSFQNLADTILRLLCLLQLAIAVEFVILTIFAISCLHFCKQFPLKILGLKLLKKISICFLRQSSVLDRSEPELNFLPLHQNFTEIFSDNSNYGSRSSIQMPRISSSCCVSGENTKNNTTSVCWL